LQEFADVSVAVSDGEVVQAHKLVLASSSSFFRKVLKAAPHPYPLIYIPGVTMQTLKALLKYMYTGEVTMTENELVSFCEAAEFFGLEGLKNQRTTRKEQLCHIEDKEGQLECDANAQEEEEGRETSMRRGRLPPEEDGLDREGRKDHEHDGDGDEEGGEEMPVTMCRLAEGEDELWRRGGDVLNHHIETLYRKEEAKAFLCSLCEKTLQSKRKIYAHIESHLDLKFSCTICEAKSPTRNALVEHARVRHNLNIGYR